MAFASATRVWRISLQRATPSTSLSRLFLHRACSSALDRPVCRSIHTTAPRHGHSPPNHEKGPIPVPEGGFDLRMPPEQAAQIFQLFADFFPPPAVIPRGWSAAWGTWDRLLSLFWRAPYFLRLPQLAMLANVRYALRGRLAPLLFSEDGSALVFQAGDRFYVYRFAAERMARFEGEWDKEALAAAMARKGVDALPVKEVPIDPTGARLLERILQRDETVVKELSECLGYTPTVTTIQEELQDIVLPQS